jgi:hypothetical protein
VPVKAFDTGRINMGADVINVRVYARIHVKIKLAHAPEMQERRSR